jgi:hypothetical protein
MKKVLIILSITSALVAGFFFGKGKTPITAAKTSSKAKSEILPLLEELKRNPTPELYEKVFLLLLAEIGFNSFKFEIPTIEKTVEKTVMKEIEVVKEKECPPQKKSQTPKKAKFEKKTQNFKQYFYNKKIDDLYKSSYALSAPFEHKLSNITFEVNKKGYDNDRYLYSIKTDFKHNGKFWSGNFSALLEGENSGQLDRLDVKGPNTVVLLAPTKPESLLIDMKEYLVQINYNQKRLKNGFIYKRRGKSLIPWATLREAFFKE